MQTWYHEFCVSACHPCFLRIQMVCHVCYRNMLRVSLMEGDIGRAISRGEESESLPAIEPADRSCEPFGAQLRLFGYVQRLAALHLDLAREHGRPGLSRVVKNEWPPAVS